MRTFNVYTPNADYVIRASDAYMARRKVYFQLRGRVPFESITAVAA